MALDTSPVEPLEVRTVMELLGDVVRAFLESITSSGLVDADGRLWWRTDTGALVPVTLPIEAENFSIVGNSVVWSVQ